jgi:S-adenosylmethionine:tRNA ribosyltransferase-isomerase
MVTFARLPDDKDRTIAPMLLSDFDFELPPGLIAQEPAPARDQSRLLVLDRRAEALAHLHTSDLPALLSPGDLVVVNDTRVIPARLHGHRVPSGGHVECLLLRRLDDERWDVLVHPGQKIRPGGRFAFEAAGVRLEAEVLGRHTFGRRTIRLWRPDDGDVDDAIERIGEVPLPPYIKRSLTEADRERYQTVYAKVRGSVAAPTAGLHLTSDTLARFVTRGIEIAEITLHVGYGTFAPLRTDVVEDHRIAPEPYRISDEAADAINRALEAGRRIVAVGTTTTRTLETVAAEHGGRVVPGSGDAGLFIYPGFQFRVVRALLTNFHLPKSSLLLLVSALAGRDRVLDAYREAVARRYRFYSYGDAMLIV